MGSDDIRDPFGPVGEGPDPAAAEGPPDGLELELEPLPTHAEVEQLRRERDEYLDQLQRERAEFANFRRRAERDRVAQRAATTREVVLAVLPVLDNLERAVSALGQRDPELAGGVDMVRVQLAQVLSECGLSEVVAFGQPFDPNLHDAIASVPSPEHPEGTVVEVVEKGYRTESELVRAAKVVVAAPPPAAGGN